MGRSRPTRATGSGRPGRTSSLTACAGKTLVRIDLDPNLEQAWRQERQSSQVQQAVDRGLPKTKLTGIPFRMEMSGFARLEGSLPVTADIGIAWPVLAAKVAGKLGIELDFLSAPQETREGKEMRAWISDNVQPLDRARMHESMRGLRAASGDSMTPNASAKAQETLPGIALSPNYKWYVVGMLWFCGFFNYADRQAIFSIFPLLQNTLHLDKVQLGLLGSSFALVYGICAPFAGNIVDRVRRKSAVLWGLQTWSIICMLTAVSRNFGTLLFFRAAEGSRRDVLLPRLDVAHQRLSRAQDALARHGHPSDHRLHRHHRRRILRRADRPVLRLALVVRRLRRTGRAARVGADEVPGRAGARRGGPRGFPGRQAPRPPTCRCRISSR